MDMRSTFYDTMNNIFTIFFLALLCGSATVAAQTKVQLRIPDTTVTDTSQLICIPVIADSFPDIAAVQFSVTWDTTQIEFQNVDFGANPLDLNSGSTSSITPGTFAVSTITPDLSGNTLAPGTPIFELCFRATMMMGSTELHFRGMPPPEFAQAGQVTSFPYDTIPGILSYADDGSNGGGNAISVLPGDTDENGQVDHRDVLNIGLGSNATGPARDNTTVQFAPTDVEAWDQSFLIGTNYAHADADGNGTVQDEDVIIVNNFYGRSTGNYRPAAASFSDETAPQLTLTPLTPAEDILTGRPLTLAVNLDNSGSVLLAHGLAFTLVFNPQHFAVADIQTDFNGSSFADGMTNNLAPTVVGSQLAGRYNVGLTRNNLRDADVTRSPVAIITLLPLAQANSMDYATLFEIVPNVLIGADQEAMPVRGTSLAQLITDDSVADREPTWARELTIYPNPVTEGPVYLRGAATVTLEEIQVVDAAGRLVQSYAGNVRELNLAELPRGTYVVRLLANGEVANRPIVKQ